MEIVDTKKSSSGEYVKIENGAFAFVPAPLPPKINYDKEIIYYLTRADNALGELKGNLTATFKHIPVPNPFLLGGIKGKEIRIYEKIGQHERYQRPKKPFQDMGRR